MSINHARYMLKTLQEKAEHTEISMTELLHTLVVLVEDLHDEMDEMIGYEINRHQYYDHDGNTDEY